MTEEGEKVVSESTTNESSLDDGWEGPRERKVGKTNGDKEDSFSPEKKTSEGVQLLTYFEAPPHLRFNQYVLGSYRPPMDVHGCLARLVKCYFCEYWIERGLKPTGKYQILTRTSIFFNSKLSFFSLTYFHNETINILTHAGANKQVSLYCCLFLFSSCVPNRGGRSLDASLGRDLRPLAPIDPRCCLHGALGEIGGWTLTTRVESSSRTDHLIVC